MGTRRQAKNVTGAGNPSCFSGTLGGPLPSLFRFFQDQERANLSEAGYPWIKEAARFPCQLCLMKNEEVTVISSSSTSRGPDPGEAFPGPKGRVAPASLG